ncbi:MAG: hypothetical protein IJJ34_10945 [Clostridia bacterium]|nr:hypothetical protein [Clostridia bacterium]
MIRKATIIIASLVLCCVILTSGTVKAEGDTIFTLTYPDGTVVTTDDEEEAQRLADEWKLLYTGTTDDKGEITLEGWAQEGQILIRETEVPSGYKAETTETTADLKDGEVTIVNQKIDVPSTGDTMKWLPWAVVGCAALIAVICIIVIRKKRTIE